MIRPSHMILACMLALAVLAGQAQAKDLVVGMSAQFLGSSRGTSIEYYRGAQAYFDYAVQEGLAPRGHRVRILARDDGYEPRRAVANTMRFLEDDQVLALFNYFGTPTTTRVLPLLQRYQSQGYRLFFPFTGAQPSREGPYHRLAFNLRPSYQAETEAVVNRLVALGYRRLAVFHQADAYGRSGWDGVRRALATHGLEMVASATYNRGQQFNHDYRPALAVLRAGAPDAIVLVATPQASAGLIRDLRQSGWGVTLANLSVDSDLLLELLASLNGTLEQNVRGLICTQVVPSPQETQVPVVNEYLRVMARHAPGLPEGIPELGYRPRNRTYVGLEGFLAAKLFGQIVERLGPDPQRQGLADAALAAPNFDLGLGETVRFSADTQQALQQVYFTEVVHGRFQAIREWSHLAP